MVDLFQIFHAIWRQVLGYGRKDPNKNVDHTQVFWSQLDENLLGEIMGKLSLSNQARFHAVCKRWHSVHPITTCKSLPWFVSIEKVTPIFSNTIACRLYEPDYSSPKLLVSTHKISLSELGVPVCWSIGNAIDISAKLVHDWLFISVTRKTLFPNTCLTYFSLFSPLTRKLIQLPKLDYPFISRGFTRTFSTDDPNSPDCVFLISKTSDKRKFLVMTCRQSDKEWTVRKLVDYHVPGYYKTSYINGSFVFVSPSGELASYDIMDGKLETENLDMDDDLEEMFFSYRRGRVFELNGDIVMLYLGHELGHLRNDNNTSPGILCIKRFDRITKTWVSLRSLEDQTLFVGDDIPNIMKVGVEQARYIGVLSNAIYYYYDQGCIIYSFDNGVLVQLKYNATETDEKIKELLECQSENGVLVHLKYNDVLQYQYDSVVTCRNIKGRSCYWLEPPVVR